MQTLLDSHLWQCCYSESYLLKFTDLTTRVGTAFPSIFPGVHGGMIPITLIASRFSEGSTPRRTEIWLMEPSVFTTKEQVTRPCTPRQYASCG